MASRVSSRGVVLDSWPVLEWIKDREPTASQFKTLLRELVTDSAEIAMSRINYGEVVYTVRKAPDIGDRVQAQAAVTGLPINVYTVDDALVDEATELKSRYPIAFGDAFAAALAIRLAMPVVTGDPEFRRLEADGVVELLWVGA